MKWDYHVSVTGRAHTRRPEMNDCSGPWVDPDGNPLFPAGDAWLQQVSGGKAIHVGPDEAEYRFTLTPEGVREVNNQHLSITGEGWSYSVNSRFAVWHYNEKEVWLLARSGCVMPFIVSRHNVIPDPEQAGGENK